MGGCLWNLEQFLGVLESVSMVMSLNIFFINYEFIKLQILNKISMATRVS